MAGTVVADTLKDGSANQLSVTRIVKGAAAAWVRFTASTGAVLASYNVSSVTRTAAGDHTVNFTASLTDGNYVVVTNVQAANGTGLVNSYESTTTGRSTSAVRLFTCQNAGTGVDQGSHQVAVFGN